MTVKLRVDGGFRHYIAEKGNGGNRISSKIYWTNIGQSDFRSGRIFATFRSSVDPEMHIAWTLAGEFFATPYKTGLMKNQIKQLCVERCHVATNWKPNRKFPREKRRKSDLTFAGFCAII